jgi:predicted deacylase
LLGRVLRHASLYVDLHSAGRNYHMLTLCGYCTVGSQATRAAEAANCFGAPVIWAHPSVSLGRTVSATLDLGIPSLYAEAFGGGHAYSDDVEVYTRGLSSLLRFLKITELDGANPGVRAPLRLGGSGDLDSAINCRHSGLFFSSISLGTRLKEGDALGVLRGLDGRVLEKVRTPQDGVLVLIRATPRTFAGELVAAVANEEPL